MRMGQYDTWHKSLARTTPGAGATAHDDGAGPHIKTKSIPNVSTDRLRRSLDFHHGAIHTPEGLHEFDNPRRSLIESGMRVRAITNELKLRGESPGDCKHCWG